MIYSLFIAVQSVSGIAIFIMLETYRFLQYNVNNLNVKIIEADLIKITKRYVKHNADKLAELIMKNM